MITGGDGTLEECLPALIDYKIPVAVLRKSGSAAEALEYLSKKLYTDWNDLLFFADTALELVPQLSSFLSKCKRVVS